jgi:DUF4097 and DUF4098 domain-containing protein YvlB
MIMKRALLLLMLMIPVALFSQKKADFEKEFNTSPGKKLDVDLQTGGAISITGWDKDVVTVKGFREGRDGKDAILEMEDQSSVISLSSRYQGSRHNRNGGVRLEISVPHRYDMHLETMGGGIAIENVEGLIAGKTMGGPLELRGLKGELDLLTMGGPVNLKNSNVDGSVKTMGGEVLLEDVTGGVKGSSMGGKVIQHNVSSHAGDPGGHEINITTMGGEIDISEAPLGADLHTMGGPIHVKNAARFVKAKTMGGPIHLDAVDGWVEATTMGGDIEVTMTGDPSAGKRSVSLTSMAGDVVLRVPAGLSMNIDVELAYTRNYNGEHQIISDFPLHQEETPEWERENGTPRKVISGTGEVAGGKNAIRIKTINGNVTIKKV